jgi:hypothetical protein
MIAKSYQFEKTEIIMMKYNHLYNVLRLVKGEQSQIMRNLTFEDADDIYTYWMDLETGVDK